MSKRLGCHLRVFSIRASIFLPHITLSQTYLANLYPINRLLKLLRLSTSLTSSLSHPPFFSRLSESLERSTKAVIKLNLLRLTKVVCECHPDKATLVERFGLAQIVERLSKQDGAVLVRELAKEILPGLLFGGDAPNPAASLRYACSGTVGEEMNGKTMKSGGRMEGKRSSRLRRTLSENVATDVLHPAPPVAPLPSIVSRCTHTKERDYEGDKKGDEGKREK